MAEFGGGGGGGYGRAFGRYAQEDLPKPRITKSLLKRILSYFRPYWKYLALSLFAISVSSLLGLVPPLLTRSMIDTALPGRDLGLLAMLTGASLAATVALGLIDVGSNYLDSWTSSHIIFDIRNAMYRHLEHMSLAFFSIVKPGDIITRMTSDISGIQDVYRTTIVSLARNVAMLLFTAVALFAMDWRLAIIGLVIVPLFAIPTKKVGRVRWKIASQTQAKVQDMNQVVQETLSVSGSTLMKIFGREKDEFGKFEGFNQEATKLQIKESVAGRWFGLVLGVFTTIGPLSIYFFGGMEYIRGTITIGEIVAFVALLARLYGPVVSISNVHIDLTRSLALFERIFDYLDLKQDIADRPDARAAGAFDGRVEFDDVTFSYTGKANVLEGVSFVAEPGTMTALVGPSGAGKTTLTHLIPRLYDTTGGAVRIDGSDVRDLTIASLRSNFGIVMQEPYLFNASVRENLLYAKADATDEEIVAACRAANIHDYIQSLPDGYGTIVGNRGIKLSGGEKQRVSIARVILKDPRIIIMDEATSSLDSLSEQLIQQAMEPLLRGRTSFVIAHRLSTVLSADRILVLDHGRVVESGTHAELLERCGLYKVLYDTQFRAYAGPLELA